MQGSYYVNPAFLFSVRRLFYYSWAFMSIYRYMQCLFQMLFREMMSRNIFTLANRFTHICNQGAF